MEFVFDNYWNCNQDFAPESEILEFRSTIKDTALIGLINDVQLKYTGADVSAAALFSQYSNLELEM